MKVIVFSCKYSELLPYFAEQFNKYYSPNQAVLVLSPNNIQSGLPSNFSVYRLPAYTSSWCNDLMPFFDQFEDEYFLSCMEDHFLHDKVDRKVIDEACNLLDHRMIDKFGFQIGPRKGAIPFAPNKSYKQLTTLCNLASSLQPSLWRTSFFKKVLLASKDKNAWQFETDNKQPYLVNSHTCIYKESPEPWPVADIVRNGGENSGFWEPRLTDNDDKVAFRKASDKIFYEKYGTTY